VPVQAATPVENYSLRYGQEKFSEESQVNVYLCQRAHPSLMSPKSGPHQLTELALMRTQPTRQLGRHAWQKRQELSRKLLTVQPADSLSWASYCQTCCQEQRRTARRGQLLLSVGTP